MNKDDLLESLIRESFIKQVVEDPSILDKLIEMLEDEDLSKDEYFPTDNNSDIKDETNN